MSKSKKYIIFGGAGFIGTHLVRHILQSDPDSEILIADLKTTSEGTLHKVIKPYLPTGRIKFHRCDVRNQISPQLEDIDNVDVIINLAAVHREPGHLPSEYFETNLQGARNINEFATQAHCRLLVFTSSIAPYGPTEETRTEHSIPVPETPYGCSKLIAEKIHEAWAEKHTDNRLVIVRPGVVFGAGEGGNVSRMIRAINKNYFVYMGNKETRKAGIYVKELCRIIEWGVSRSDSHKIQLANAAMNPCPSIQDYSSVINKLLGRRRKTLSTPFHLIYFLSYAINFLANLARISQPINPVRIRKLVRSNNIQPKYLLDSGYDYKYSLEQAMTDWKNDSPSEWDG